MWKMRMFCLKNPQSDFSMEKKEVSHSGESLPEQGSYLCPPLSFNPLGSSQGVKNIADAKYRASSALSQHREK